jgi:hypothetical protein
MLLEMKLSLATQPQESRVSRHSGFPIRKQFWNGTFSVRGIPLWIRSIWSTRTCQPHPDDLTVVSSHLFVHFHTSHVSNLSTLPTLDLGPVSDHCLKFIRRRKPIVHSSTYQFQSITSYFLECTLTYSSSIRKECGDG